jgi:LCP family protein required for cell wall assembly
MARLMEDPPNPNRHTVTAPLASFVFPGLGQALNRQPRLAIAFALPFVAAAGSAVVALKWARVDLLDQLLSVQFLTIMLAANGILLLLRLLSIAQAHGRSPGGLAKARQRVTTTVLLLVLALEIHAIPGLYLVSAIDTLTAVSLPAQPNSGGEATGSGAHAFDGLVRLRPPEHLPNLSTESRINILLIGIDSGPGRTTHLTDTMMLLSLDASGGRAAMISVPRDLYGVPLPSGQLYQAKLNSLLVRAESEPALFPAGGIATLKATIGRLLGCQVHYFAAVDLAGFESLVNSVGGVDLNVPEDIHDDFFNFNLAAGIHHLNGATALTFVRSRHGQGNDDFKRANRQQLLLLAVRDAIARNGIGQDLTALLDAVKQTIKTDIPQDRLAEVARLVGQTQVGEIERLVLDPPRYVTPAIGSDGAYILIPHLALIRAVGQQLTQQRGIGRS